MTLIISKEIFHCYSVCFPLKNIINKQNKSSHYYYALVVVASGRLRGGPELEMTTPNGRLTNLVASGQWRRQDLG